MSSGSALSPYEAAENIQNVLDDVIFSSYTSHDYWEMTMIERCTLITLLREIMPEIAIEIGTRNGGSLSVLSRFSKHVYTLDIDSTCQVRLGQKFPNVTFVTGRSQDTLLLLLKELSASKYSIGCILIDGEHTRQGVKQDIEHVLTYQPSQPLYLIIHDSFNPECRQGIVDADWLSNPYVHFVELDFVPGIFHERADLYRQMWGGFALAILEPTKRSGKLTLTREHELLFQTVLGPSFHDRTTMKLVKMTVFALWQKFIRRVFLMAINTRTN